MFYIFEADYFFSKSHLHQSKIFLILITKQETNKQAKNNQTNKLKKHTSGIL